MTLAEVASHVLEVLPYEVAVLVDAYDDVITIKVHRSLFFNPEWIEPLKTAFGRDRYLVHETHGRRTVISLRSYRTRYCS